MLAMESVMVVPNGGTILLVITAVFCVLMISTWSASRVIRRVEDLGAGYTDLYKTQHREVMDALQSETHRALKETKALVMEHSELERILRVLATRAGADDADYDRRIQHVEPDK